MGRAIGERQAFNKVGKGRNATRVVKSVGSATTSQTSAMGSVTERGANDSVTNTA